jgi:hypothetical protein
MGKYSTAFHWKNWPKTQKKDFFHIGMTDAIINA